MAESLLLKHQLLILNRTRTRAPALQPTDRVVAGLCAILIRPTRLVRSAIVLKPSTILRFHKALVKRKYRLLFTQLYGRKRGPKGPSRELISAIVEMKYRNPRFGYQRIADQISLTFDVDLDKDVVRRVLAKHYRSKPGSNGPSWLTFLGHTNDSLWSVDLFRCESLILKSHWVMVIMDQSTRRIIGFAAYGGTVDRAMACRMFNKIISAANSNPRYLSSDYDPLFTYHQWQANLRILDVEEIKSVPYTPTSHPFIERLIGNRVVEQFGVNILIICFSGISKTWRENSQNSLNTITRIGHINHLTVKRLTLSAVRFNHDAYCSRNILGIHTAMGFTIRRLLRDL